MEQKGVMEAAERGDLSVRPKYDADDRSGSSEKDAAQHLEQKV
jgi:hypothetical protein